MCPVNYFYIVLCSSLTLFCTKADIYPSFKDVAQGKPICVWFQNGTSSKFVVKEKTIKFVSSRVKCSFSPLYATSTVDIDLLEPIDVIEIRIGGKFSSRQTKAYVNKARCKMLHVEFRQALFNCTNVKAGRTVKITFHAGTNFEFCGLEVFSCKDGLKGPSCESPCNNSTYGIGCSRHCSCSKEGEGCDGESGHCLSGCGSSTLRSKDCYIKSVLESGRWLIVPFYDNMATIAFQPHHFGFRGSEDKNDRTVLQDLISHTSFQNISGDCFQLFPRRGYTSTWLEIKLEKKLSVYGVQMELMSDTSYPTAVLSVHLGSTPCYVSSKLVSYDGTNRSITFLCHPGPQVAQSVRIMVSSNFHQRSELQICGLRWMVCSLGMYGPHCTVPCQCSVGGCDPVTGQCLQQSPCKPGSRGPSCASIDLAYHHLRFISRYRSKSKRPRRSWSKHAFRGLRAIAYYEQSGKVWISWLAVYFDGVYQINHVTVTPSKHYSKHFRNVSIYTDTRVPLTTPPFRSSERLDLSGPLGLPCEADVESGFTGADIEIPCIRLARSVVLVLWGQRPALTAFVDNVEVWGCLDGTYGPQCEHVCNCEQSEDVCDKETGHCPMGCNHGFIGVDCQQRCRPDSQERTCTEILSECHCLDTWECFLDSGSCPSGCMAGFWGPGCHLQCWPGVYGRDCKLQCPACLQTGNETQWCDPVTGICPLGLEQVSLESLGTEARLVIVGVLIFIFLMLCAACVVLTHCTITKDPSLELERNFDRNIRNAVYADLNKYILQTKIDLREKQIKEKAMKALSLKEHSRHTGDVDPPTRPFVTKEQRAGMREVLPPQRISPGMGTDGRCAPLEDNRQEHPLYKVALWILHQDFDELINRRLVRLHDFDEDPIEMEESDYETSVIALSVSDIHQLYDQAGNLQLP